MYLAIDIGGTKTLIALFSKRGRILRRRKFRTAQGYRDFINDLTSYLEAFRHFKIKSVMVAIPGIVQKNCSFVFGNRNWANIDLVSPIKKLFDCPIYFENDANTATLFEAHRLSGKTVFLTFSTGIGGGIVEHGQILPESDQFEPGHIKYEYNGKKKEWEDIAAASAIESAFHVDYATDLRKKDELKEVAQRVYLGLPDIVQTYHPDTIILGGPLGKIFNLYVKYLPKIEGVKYRAPKRPNESVIYGAYLLSKQKERA